MANQAPKSFPREHLLNVAGTFDDKVREMLVSKSTDDLKPSGVNSKDGNPDTKMVPGIRKSITKPNISQKPTHQFKNQGGHQGRQHYGNKLAQAPFFHQAPLNQNGYPTQNSNPMPHIYPNGYSQNRGYYNDNRYPQTSPNNKPLHGAPHNYYPPNFSRQKPQHFYNKKPTNNVSQPDGFGLKSEDSTYSTQDPGPLLLPEGHDTFSNGSTASTNELTINRGNSFNGQINPNFNPNYQNFNRFDRNRMSHAGLSKPFNKKTGMMPTDNYLTNERTHLDGMEPLELDQGLGHSFPMRKNKKKKKKKKKPKLMKKPGNPDDHPIFTGKGSNVLRPYENMNKTARGPLRMQDDIEEGELPENSRFGGHILLGTMIQNEALFERNDAQFSKKNTKSFIQEDLIPFMYDSKAFFIDAANFTCSLT